MPNLKLAPRLAARRTSRHRRRRTSRRKTSHGWWRAVKVAVLVERLRRRPSRRPSSPSVRQLALVIVTGGLVIMLIRVATRKAKRHADGPEVAPAQAGDQDDTPDEARESPTAPATGRNDTVAGSERRLTDRVQQEMSRRADAPSQAGGSASGSG
ncbi:MAG: hypothetical protein WB761_12400 [Solirubrobacteraceae bacterium]